MVHFTSKGLSYKCCLISISLCKDLSYPITFFQTMLSFSYAGLSDIEIIGIILSTSFGTWILIITMSLCVGFVRRARLSQTAKPEIMTQSQLQLPAIVSNDAIPTDVTSFITTNSTYFNPLYEPDEFDDDGLYYGPNRQNVRS